MAQVAARGAVITAHGVVGGDVIVDGDTIVEVRQHDRVPTDRWVCPGFVDLQINGSHGIDVGAAPERVAELAALAPADGVTSFLPTVITCAEPARVDALEAIRRAVTEPGHVGRSSILGAHLEGPVLSPVRPGAHPVEHLAAPSEAAASGWTLDRGVRLVTLAPELPGALELIGRLVAAGVVVSLGHTDATAEQFQEGLAAGASMATHLFNAMRPFSHRDPGPVGAVLADDVVVAGIIADGIHVDPVAVRMAWRALGPDRLALVTDAVAARGSGAASRGVRTPAGVLAGSDLTMDEALRNLIAWTRASVPDAVRTVSSTPARVLGLTDRGVIAPGRRADLTVLDHELRVVETIVAGVAVHAGAGRRRRSR